MAQSPPPSQRLDFSTLKIRLAERTDDLDVLAASLLRAASSDRIGLFVLDFRSAQLLWNETMYQVYGLDPLRFSGNAMTWLDCLHHEDLPRVSREVGMALSGQKPYDTMFRVRDPKGGWRLIKASGWVERDESGQVMRMAGINRDASASLRFEWQVQTLQDSLAQLGGRAFFAGLARALCAVLGVRYAMVLAQDNLSPDHFAQLLATSHDSCRPAPPELNEQVRDLHCAPCAQVMAGQTLVYASDLQISFAGDALLKMLNAQSYLGLPLKGSNGQLLGAIAIVHDQALPEPKQTQRLLELCASRAGAELESLLREAQVRQLNAELEEQVAARTASLRHTLHELEAFTYDVSHDLSVPLRAIAGFGLELKQQFGDELNDEGRDYLKRILNAADRMDRLLADLVNLSKISLRPLTLGKVRLDIVASECAVALNEQYPEFQHQLHCAAPISAYGDAGLLRILLDSLLRHIWPRLSDTKARVISMYEREFDGRREIILHDSMQSFDSQAAERLFTPFAQIGGKSTVVGGGLAIAQRVMLRHHGSIHAHSSPADGAYFRFYLPPAAELAALVQWE